MPLIALQTLLWDAMVLLKESGRMSNKEAAGICLVRFTWSTEQVQAKLEELTNRIINPSL